MNEHVREFFKQERLRLGLNQTEVALRGGLTQAMVSRIEIAPDYEPTVPVFEKAVRGLGLTLASFFARIEGLPQTEQLPVPTTPPPPPPPPDTVPTDDPVSALATQTAFAEALYTLAKIHTEAIARGTAAERRPDRGHVAAGRPGNAGVGAPDGRNRTRHPHRGTKAKKRQ